jgi:transposase
MKTAYCGLDISIKSIQVCISNENREVIEESKCATDEQALRVLLKRHKKLMCLVEASPLAEWVCSVVEECGHRITIICPRRAKGVMSTKKKTDRIDARNLAELCLGGWYTPVHRKSGHARELRSYLTARMQLVKASGALRSSIAGIFLAHGVALTAGEEDEGFVGKVMAHLSKLPSMVQRAIGELLVVWEDVHERQRRMYRQLEKLIKTDETIALLASYPGVGPATAAAYVATIDNPGRFSDGSKVAAYLGLVPSVYQSGSVEYRGRITKTGDPLLRSLLVEAASSILSRCKQDCELKRWGLKLKEQKGYGKAAVAVARKLACLLHHAWVKNEAYEEAVEHKAAA